MERKIIQRNPVTYSQKNLILGVSGLPEHNGPFQRNRLVAPEVIHTRQDTQRHQPESLDLPQEAIRSELLTMQQVQDTEDGVIVRTNGVFQQKKRIDTYTITHEDGTQTVYVQQVDKKGAEQGVYEEHYGPVTKSGKRQLLSREKVGEFMEFTPERKADGTIEKSKSYKGELAVFSESVIRKETQLESMIEKESLRETIARLNVDFVPLPESQSNSMKVIQNLSVIQSGLSMVKDSPKEQAILGLQTFTISTLSSAFVLGIPIAGPLGIVKNIGDFAVVTEAYQLLRSPNQKERLKNLPWNLVKNVLMPFVFLHGLIQQTQALTQERSQQRKLMQEYQALNPYITDRKRLERKVRGEELYQSHGAWVQYLERVNPHLSKDVVREIASKYLDERSRELQALQKDAQAVVRANVVPFAVYVAVFGAATAASLIFGAGIPLLVAGLGASALSGLSRPIVNYTLLKNIRDRIKKERPDELRPVAEILQQQRAS